MKLTCKSLLIATAAGWAATAAAQLQFQSDARPQQVFAGNGRNISVIWRNPGDETAEARIRLRIFQTTSATAVLVAETDWKKLTALPHQTILDSAPVDFPAVKAETKFLVQWTAASKTNEIFGTTEVLIYPTNLLTELKALAGGAVIGVYDPRNALKPLLTNAGIGFINLENSNLENFSGKLAIVYASPVRLQPGRDFSKRIKALAKKNVPVILIQPPAESARKPTPSFYSVMVNTNSIVVVQPDLVSDLTEKPESQLNLVYFFKLALNRQSLPSFDLASQP